MTPCTTCGHINVYAERYPHPNVVRGELAAIITERNQADRQAHATFRSELRRRLMADYRHDYTHRPDGRTITN